MDLALAQVHVYLYIDVTSDDVVLGSPVIGEIQYQAFPQLFIDIINDDITPDPLIKSLILIYTRVTRGDSHCDNLHVIYH